MTGLNKRKTKSIPIIAYEKEDLPELIEKLVSIIENTEWNYSSEFRDILIMRDKAIVATLLLSGLRISEANQLKLSQIKEQSKRFLLLGVNTLKNGDVRDRIVIPKDGILGQLTVYFDKWYRYLMQKPKAFFLFPSGCAFGLTYRNFIPSCRVHQIMKNTTNYFPHWCRAVYENVYGHIVFENDAWKLKVYGFKAYGFYRALCSI